MYADGYRQPLSFPGGSLLVPVLNVGQQLKGAGERAVRDIAFVPKRAERGHESIAKVLVERAFMTEHHTGASLLEASEKRERPAREKVAH